MTTPLTMPDGVATEYFEPERVDAVSPRSDGRVTGVSVGFPLWRARWTLGQAMDRATSEQWRAFVARLRGVQRTFFGYDHGRPYPLAAIKGFTGLTRHAGGAFDGTATSWSVNSDRDTPTLNGLPSTFPLTFGDYIMWRWTTGGEARRSLHRVVVPATASGGVVSPVVEPPLPTFIPSDAVADLARPNCIMRLVPGETRVGEKGRTLRVDATIVAIQDLRD